MPGGCSRTSRGRTARARSWSIAMLRVIVVSHAASGGPSGLNDEHFDHALHERVLHGVLGVLAVGDDGHRLGEQAGSVGGVGGGEPGLGAEPGAGPSAWRAGHGDYSARVSSSSPCRATGCEPVEIRIPGRPVRTWATTGVRRPLTEQLAQRLGHGARGEQRARGLADHHLPGERRGLQPGGDVHGVAHRVEVAQLGAADVADERGPGVDPHPEPRPARLGDGVDPRPACAARPRRRAGRGRVGGPGR